ncbi:MAG: SURF1 family protein [Methylobacter sp.]|nr:SURF1 family protein [Methylobacter sp.]
MKFEFVPTLAYLCLLPVLIALGIWQLERSEQKRAYLELEHRQAVSEVLHLSPTTEDNKEALKYRKVEVKGHYDTAHQFLIDNQVSDGKPGYFVLTPFILEGAAKAVLVNRGWIPLNRDRSVLPNVEIKKLQATITGRVNNFPSVGIKLAGADVPTDTWPAVVQVADSHILAKTLGYPLFQFQIELDKDLPDGFKREWRTTTLMLPEQHIAYAVQWFALALILTIIFIWYSFKKNNG